MDYAGTLVWGKSCNHSIDIHLHCGITSKVLYKLYGLIGLVLFSMIITISNSHPHCNPETQYASVACVYVCMCVAFDYLSIFFSKSPLIMSGTNCKYVCLVVCLSVFLCVCLLICLSIYICIYMYMHIYICMHPHEYVCMYICIIKYIYMCVSAFC